MANNKQPEGRWVTIRGRRVFISDVDSFNKSNPIKKVTWQDRDADKKDREIEARQKEVDERNGKSVRQRNIEALGLDEKKVNNKLLNDYEANLKEALRTKDVNKKAELNKWLSRNEKSYNEVIDKLYKKYTEKGMMSNKPLAVELGFLEDIARGNVSESQFRGYAIRRWSNYLLDKFYSIYNTSKKDGVDAALSAIFRSK